jgi:hypothetical protein
LVSLNSRSQVFLLNCRLFSLFILVRSTLPKGIEYNQKGLTNDRRAIRPFFSPFLNGKKGLINYFVFHNFMIINLKILDFIHCIII